MNPNPHSEGNTAFLITPLLPQEGDDQPQEAAAPKANTEREKQVLGRGCAPYLCSKVQPRVLQVLPKPTEAAEQGAAPLSPLHQSPVSGFQRDGHQQNLAAASLPGLGESGE